jgi:hypothetical protein
MQPKHGAATEKRGPEQSQKPKYGAATENRRTGTISETKGPSSAILTKRYDVPYK